MANSTERLCKTYLHNRSSLVILDVTDPELLFQRDVLGEALESELDVRSR